MSDQRGEAPLARIPAWLPRAVLAATVVFAGAGICFAILDRTRSPAGASLLDLPFLSAFAAFPIVGYILTSRRPDNSVGWLIAGVGLVFGLDGLLSTYAGYAVHGGLGGYRLGAITAAIESPMWIPIVVTPATFLLVLFPSGVFPSDRWRRLAKLATAGWGVLFVTIVLGPGKLDSGPLPNIQNPLGQEWLRPITPIVLILVLMIPVAVVACVTNLIRRFRRSSGLERLQLKWLVTAAAIVGSLYAVAIPVGLVTGWNNSQQPFVVDVFQAIAIASFGLLPVAIGISILRYRLLEIDLVINRALLVGGLALFITAVYVGVVVGVGALVGSRSDPVLSAVAAAIVALAFQPVRRRAQRLVDRLVYGQRATPYEVLSEFSEKIGGVYASDDLLERMARTVAAGTAAVRTTVFVRVGDELRSAATWPSDGSPAEPIGTNEIGDGRSTSSSLLVPVRHDGELLGALSLDKRAGESLASTEERLVRDLASQAGLVMRNAALTQELMDNIDQLRASRKRLVSAQDDERRKLERDLHDGAQQQIVALGVKIRLLEGLIGSDQDKARSIASDLQGEIGSALEELRRLAHGIYPPLLSDKGLAAALESQARRAVVPVAVAAEGVGRYPRDVETAVYFSCLEALQNVQKYARASNVTVRLADGDGGLRFEVSDDGIGFDEGKVSQGSGLTGMTDRVAAVGGSLRIRSEPGRGTTVSGEIPAVARKT